MSKRKIEIPIAAIVTLVEYLDVSQERKHFEDMQRNGEDVSEHVWLSIQAVTAWLDSEGVPYRDPTAELERDLADAFAAVGVNVTDRDVGQN